MALLAMMLFVGCQEEYIHITQPDQKNSFAANDTLAELILRVTMKDGSFDNFLDECSAISIKFPYSVRIRNEDITITSVEDINELEEEYLPFEGSIRFNYPVTVIFSDYSESVISNRGELQRIQNQFSNEYDEDLDIECIDFVYPIEISIYNTEFQKPDFVIVDSDKVFHGILKKANDLVVEITYPVSVELWDGDRISVQNNTELENEILNAMGKCDEDDFNVDYYQDIQSLSSGSWRITLYSDTTDETSAFTLFLFEFNPDFTIQAVSGSETFRGTWEPDFEESMKVAEIEFDTDDNSLIWLNEEWEILVLNDEIIILQAESDSEGRIKKLNLSGTD